MTMNRDEFLEEHIVARSSRWWVMWRVFFPGADMAKCVILWRGRLYIPAGKSYESLGVDIAYHERIHYHQQLKHGWLWWWIKYRLSRQFRLKQELEAYKAQYEWGKQIMPDFRGRVSYLHELADGMSGPTYGLGITKVDAMDMIYPKDGTVAQR